MDLLSYHASKSYCVKQEDGFTPEGLVISNAENIEDSQLLGFESIKPPLMKEATRTFFRIFMWHPILARARLHPNSVLLSEGKSNDSQNSQISDQVTTSNMDFRNLFGSDFFLLQKRIYSPEQCLNECVGSGDACGSITYTRNADYNSGELFSSADLPMILLTGVGGACVLRAGPVDQWTKSGKLGSGVTHTVVSFKHTGVTTRIYDYKLDTEDPETGEKKSNEQLYLDLAYKVQDREALQVKYELKNSDVIMTKGFSASAEDGKGGPDFTRDLKKVAEAGEIDLEQMNVVGSKNGPTITMSYLDSLDECEQKCADFNDNAMEMLALQFAGGNREELARILANSGNADFMPSLNNRFCLAVNYFAFPYKAGTENKYDNEPKKNYEKVPSYFSPAFSVDQLENRCTHKMHTREAFSQEDLLNLEKRKQYDVEVLDTKLIDSAFESYRSPLSVTKTRQLNLAQKLFVESPWIRPKKEFGDSGVSCTPPKHLVSEYNASWSLTLKMKASQVRYLHLSASHYGANKKKTVVGGKNVVGNEFFVDVFVDGQPCNRPDKDLIVHNNAQMVDGDKNPFKTPEDSRFRFLQNSAHKIFKMPEHRFQVTTANNAMDIVCGQFRGEELDVESARSGSDEVFIEFHTPDGDSRSRDNFSLCQLEVWGGDGVY